VTAADTGVGGKPPPPRIVSTTRRFGIPNLSLVSEQQSDNGIGYAEAGIMLMAIGSLAAGDLGQFCGGEGKSNVGHIRDRGGYELTQRDP